MGFSNMCKFAHVKKFKVVSVCWNFVFYIKYIIFLKIIVVSNKKLLLLVSLRCAILHKIAKPKLYLQSLKNDPAKKKNHIF